MENISREFNSVYWAMITTSIFGIFLSFVWILRNKKKIGYAVGPFFLFINVLLYTVALKLEMLSHQQNELWEGIIILHSLFLSIALLVVMPPTTSIMLKNVEKNKNDRNS